MSRPFSYNSAKSSFAQVKEPVEASTYTQTKKAKYIFYQCQCQYVEFDKTQLFTNLYTKLDLSDLSGNTPVISDLSGNNFPASISTSVTPYLKYNIDPSGVLFGNTPCGINNYLNFISYDITSNSVI